MASTLAVNIIVAFVALVITIIYTERTEFALQKINEIVNRKPGCNPIPSVGNVSLHYFAGRGRGEVIRMLMANAEVPWSETKFTKETWQDAKQIGIKDGLYKFGQVPAVVTSDGHRLVQTLAILHFLARSAGYDCDCADLDWCEQIAFGVEDISQRLSKLLYNKDEFTLVKINEYLEATLPTWLEHFERVAPVLTEKANELHFASERLTWVDFIVFNMIETNYNFESATSEARGKTADVLEKFPRLKKFYEEFKERPKLHAYLNNKDRPAFKLPYSILIS